MLRNALFLCISFGFVIASTTSLSILLLQPLLSTSHHYWTMTLATGLLQKGHHVHVVSIHEAKVNEDLAQNLTYAIFENVMKEVHENEKNNFIKWMNINEFYAIYYMYDWAISTCERITQTKGAKELAEVIKNNEFDVIVQDITFNQCLYGLWENAKGKPPVVGYIPFGLSPSLKHYIGGSHYPNVRSYLYSSVAEPTTIWQRMLNVLYYMLDDFVRCYYYMPISQRLAEQFIGHEIKPLSEFERNISVVLINTYSAFESGIPLPPNALETGGIHAQAKSPARVNAKQSEAMFKFLDGAKDGAIVISLGTNMNWRYIGLDKLKDVLFGLSKLKQRILWKLDVDMSAIMPENIMAVKWFPQNDLLNHRNVKAIWTHGGLLSIQEAIWKGIPVVAMPFCIDQKRNIDILVKKGAGLYFEFETLSTQTVLNKLEEIIYNKSYMVNMKRLSSEYRDRPLPPLDLAIWGIEYAARNPNGNLASLIRSQNWVEQNLIDIYAIFFFSLVIILVVVFFVLKILCNYFFKNLISKSRKNKQN